MDHIHGLFLQSKRIKDSPFQSFLFILSVILNQQVLDLTHQLEQMIRYNLIATHKVRFFIFADLISYSSCPHIKELLIKHQEVVQETKFEGHNFKLQAHFLEMYKSLILLIHLQATYYEFCQVLSLEAKVDVTKIQDLLIKDQLQLYL